ncbi:hypothetical protein JXQ31_09525 [candidate division KSB1 bacterium]|nr:hypothetical protein [candidate division KSB1 bacterium]
MTMKSCANIKIVLGIFFLIMSGCTKPDKNYVYGPENPDPYPANRKVAVLDSIKANPQYPTRTVTIYGSGFDTSKPENNFVWFDVARATVLNAWADSIQVTVPLSNPLNIDYFFEDSVGVKSALQNSYDWSNTIPFKYLPMTHPYIASQYPANHPEDKFTKPRGLAFDNVGNIYLVNARLRSIYKDTPAGGERTVYAFGGKFEGGLRMGTDGYLYSAGNLDNMIYRISSGGGYEAWAAVPNPWGLDFDESGNLFVVDNVNGELYKVSPDGNAEKILKFPGSGEKAYCRVYNGYVYVNDRNSGNFFRVPVTVTSADTVETIEVDSDYLVKDITFGTDGSAYITAFNGSANVILKMDNTGKTSELLEFAGDLGFITWYGDFIFISCTDGPVYEMLIHDNTSAPYYGR